MSKLKSKKITIDGIKYKSKKNRSNDCVGCAFHGCTYESRDYCWKVDCTKKVWKEKS